MLRARTAAIPPAKPSRTTKRIGVVALPRMDISYPPPVRYTSRHFFFAFPGSHRSRGFDSPFSPDPCNYIQRRDLLTTSRKKLLHHSRAVEPLGLHGSCTHRFRAPHGIRCGDTHRLHADAHRCGDVRVPQNLLNKLVANSESVQIHCDHQTGIRVSVGPCQGVNSPSRSSVKRNRRAQRPPAPAGPKPVFRTVVSALAMELICLSKSVGHANWHKRTITPGLVLQVTVRAQT